jgi:hypothetical protein
MAGRYTFKSGAVEVIMTDDTAKETQWFIKGSDVNVVEDKMFWHLRTNESTARRILTNGIDKNPHRLDKVMSRTNVVEQFAGAKHDAIQRAVSGGCEVTSKRFRATYKKFTRNRLTLPSVMTVHAPDIHDVQGIDIKVLTKRAMWIELSHENIAYFADATAAQIAAGGVEKDMCRGRKRHAPAADSSDDGDQNSSDNGGDQDGDPDLEGADGEQDVVENIDSSTEQLSPAKPCHSSSSVTMPSTKRQSSILESFKKVIDTPTSVLS